MNQLGPNLWVDERRFERRFIGLLVAIAAVVALLGWLLSEEV